MSEGTVARGLLIGLCLLLVIASAGAGVWNQQQVRACHDRYDDDPSVAVVCEDPLTHIVWGTSIVGVACGGLGAGWLLYREVT